MGAVERKSWKPARKRRSSLAAESQAMADSVDIFNFVRLFFADCLHSKGIVLRRPDGSEAPPGVVCHYGLQELV